jgi:hypothetical protein
MEEIASLSSFGDRREVHKHIPLTKHRCFEMLLGLVEWAFVNIAINLRVSHMKNGQILSNWLDCWFLE